MIPGYRSAVFFTSRSMIAIVRLRNGRAHVRSTIQAESSPQTHKRFGQIAFHRANKQWRSHLPEGRRTPRRESKQLLTLKMFALSRYM
jgi:hypothetical protein